MAFREGWFIDVLEDGVWVPGVLVSLGDGFACVSTAAYSLASVLFEEIESFATRSALHVMLDREFASEVIDRSLFLQILDEFFSGASTDDDAVQLFAGYLPLENIDNPATVKQVLTTFYWMADFEAAWVKLVLPTVTALEEQMMRSVIDSQSSALLSAHISAVGRQPCPPVLAASLSYFMHSFYPSAATANRMWSVFGPRSIENVDMSRYVLAAQNYLSYCIGAVKPKEAIETLCLVLYADSALHLLPEQFLTATLEDMTHFFDVYSCANAKAELIALLCCGSAPLITFDDLRIYRLLDCEVCGLFFQRYSVRECVRLIGMAGNSLYWSQHRRELLEFPSESSQGLSNLLLRASWKQQLSICYLLRWSKVLRSVQRSPAALAVREMMNVREARWLLIKAFGRKLGKNLSGEVLLFF